MADHWRHTEPHHTRDKKDQMDEVGYWPQHRYAQPVEWQSNPLHKRLQASQDCTLHATRAAPCAASQNGNTSRTGSARARCNFLSRSVRRFPQVTTNPRIAVAASA